MLCDICGKNAATVHLTEIIDEQMAELHLCEGCAREKSMEMEQQFGLADLLAGLSNLGEQLEAQGIANLKCRICGLTYADFKKTGRLGCSECYQCFKVYLKPLLKKIHGSAQHIGKVPANKVKAQTFPIIPQEKPHVFEKPSPLQSLKDKLQLAIQKEEFEEAAKLRDKIRELEKKSEA